jgi:porphobilinogen synthase
MQNRDRIEKWLNLKGSILNSLVMPYFVMPGTRVKQSIPWLPGLHKYSTDTLTREIDRLIESGIKAVMLFECAQQKDEQMLFTRDNLLAKCLKTVRRLFPELILVADLCVCSQTESGHCRLSKNGAFDRKRTLQAFENLAVSYAESGVDIISPSAMLKGQTRVVKRALKANGFDRVLLMPAVKTASYLYQPARIVFSRKKPALYPKKYHLPVNSRKEILAWCRKEVVDGADILMIKPALANLDIICAAQQNLGVPLAGFQPSGDYALLKFGLKKSGFQEEDLILEEIASIKRAGAAKIVTYFAGAISSWTNT